MKDTPSHRRNTPLRTHVPQRVYDWINNRKCIHVDAWLYQQPDDTLYFVILATKAGRMKQPVLHRTYRVDPFDMGYVNNIPNIANTAVERRIGGALARARFPWAAQHHEYIRQLVDDVCARYTRRSVILHYVYTNKLIDNPMEGIENTYVGSSRAERDAVAGTSVRDARRAAALAMQERPQSPWTAKERSLLRTLQKILS